VHVLVFVNYDNRV